MSQLSEAEVADLFVSVQRIGSVLQEAYKAEALSVAVQASPESAGNIMNADHQDGEAAGQSVPHVHVHLLPRQSTDFGGNTDYMYPALEALERELKDRMDAVSSAGREQKP